MSSVLGVSSCLLLLIAGPASATPSDYDIYAFVYFKQGITSGIGSKYGDINACFYWCRINKLVALL